MPRYAYSQDYTTVVFDDICNTDGMRIVPTANSKIKRLSNKRGGIVLLDDADCKDMPDSLKVALRLAADAWAGYLPLGDSLTIKVSFSNLDVDIRTLVYYGNPGLNVYYPKSLLRKITGDSSLGFDAAININKTTDWCIGIGNKTCKGAKNLSIGIFRAIATVLGFGSSVKLDKRGNIAFEFKNGKSVFDNLIFSEDGQRMENLHNGDFVGIKKFVQQDNGFLFASQKDESSKLYAPLQFDEYKSLKFLLDKNSLMYYGDSGMREPIVDEATLKLLNAIGWNIGQSTANIEIIGENIDGTGIASAYQQYRFYIKPNGMNITNYNWEYKLPLKSGGYEAVSTSSNSDFIIPAISNEEKYEHTIEGDIQGIIKFRGTVNGQDVQSSYNITLELKPHILDVKLIEISNDPNNDGYYDAVVDVAYEGSHYLYAYVEEEYSSSAQTYSSDTPYYTRLKITNIDSWGFALINITIRNEYGNDDFILELPAQASISSGLNSKALKTSNPIYIKVYDLEGRYLGRVNRYCDVKSFGRGLFVLKVYNGRGMYKIIKYKIR